MGDRRRVDARAADREWYWFGDSLSPPRVRRCFFGFQGWIWFDLTGFGPIGGRISVLGREDVGTRRGAGYGAVGSD